MAQHWHSSGATLAQESDLAQDLVRTGLGMACDRIVSALHCIPVHNNWKTEQTIAANKCCEKVVTFEANEQ